MAGNGQLNRKLAPRRSPESPLGAKVVRAQRATGIQPVPDQSCAPALGSLWPKAGQCLSADFNQNAVKAATSRPVAEANVPVR
jgi:hypothetical protein